MEQNQPQFIQEPTSTHPLEKRRKTFIGLGIGALVLIVIVVSALVLGRLKGGTATQVTTKTNNETSSIVPKTEYSNPFDKTASYVNPFSSYKNPFDNL